MERKIIVFSLNRLQQNSFPGKSSLLRTFSIDETGTKLVLKRQQYLCSQNKASPQPLFSADYNVANPTNWAIGFYANGLFLLLKTQKECFSHCKFIY